MAKEKKKMIVIAAEHEPLMVGPKGSPETSVTTYQHCVISKEIEVVYTMAEV
jgi:hypothetical protein